MRAFLHSFSKHLFSTYYLPSIILAVRDTAMEKVEGIGKSKSTDTYDSFQDGTY